MQKWEMVDKATILKYKIERGVRGCEEQYEELIKKIGDIDDQMVKNLYELNKEMFLYEEVITYAINQYDFFKVGILYTLLRDLTHKRTEAKNRIAEKYDQFGEFKKY